jgi:diguanylate cyclase (GGDEF)-like protein/putative nucleotidyltransferase with HDIG domain
VETGTPLPFCPAAGSKATPQAVDIFTSSSQHLTDETGTLNRLSLSARAYIALVIVAGSSMVALIPGELAFPRDEFSLIILAVAMALAAACQIWKVEGTTAKTSYNVALVIYGFTLVVLGPVPAILVSLFASAVEWVKHRYPWYIQTFNIFCLVVNLAASGAVYIIILGGSNPVSARGALGLLTSAFCFVFLNHLMVGFVILFARKEPFSQSGVFSKSSLLIDYSLFAIGSITALLWLVNPYTSLLMLIPLYMLSFTLKVPSLERQATTDPKTGLFNARYFQEALEKEIARANRYDRPLTVVIGDLDLLRNINNTYGHLAGDQVLIGIARILKERFRDDDVVARIGGEEFSILMPETLSTDAAGRVEQLRETIEAARFEVATSVEPIQATMSFGLAQRSRPDQIAKVLLHRADVALYRAKLEGRNLVRVEAQDEQDEPVGVSGRGDSIAFFGQPALADWPASAEPLLRDEPVIAASQDNRSFSSPDVQAAASDLHCPSPSVAAEARKPEESAGNRTRSHVRPGKKPQLWLVPAFITLVGALALTSFGVAFFALGFSPPGPWYDLGVFAVIAILAESLAIDIYVRDNSISTSGAPFLAGAMLFGPVGALVLSIVMAASAMIKHRSSLDRFVFNASAHLIAGLAASLLMSLAIRAGAGSQAWVQLGLSLACALILFAVTTWLVATVMSLNNNASVVTTWREKFRWLAPYYLVLGVLACGFLVGYERAGYVGSLVVLAPLLALRYAQTQYINHTEKMVNSLRASKLLVEQRAEEISELNEDLLVLVSNITDLQDPFMCKHCQHVSRYATLIAQELGLDDTVVDEVRKAGLLHDVGKLGIRYDLLWKPGQLTESEYEEVKRHAPLGKEILDDCSSLTSLASIICCHHENYDGSGYPGGLRGDSIPLESRILRVADTVEAIASDRAYRTGSSADAILAELEAGSGTQFDASVVAALRRAVERDGKAIILNSAEEVSIHPSELIHALSPEAKGAILQPKTRTG